MIRCTEAIRDADGQLTELRCVYDKETLGKNPVDRKVKGVIHWVSASHAHPVTIYQYDRLFNDVNPAREEDFMQFINKNSLQVKHAFAEPAIKSQLLHDVLQFERLGYYCVNDVSQGSASGFHRVVDLKDTWGKIG